MGWRDIVAQLDPCHPPRRVVLGVLDVLAIDNKKRSSLSIDNFSQNITLPKQPPTSPKPPRPHAQADVPTAPLAPGWLVAYYDHTGRLCGGCDDRARGTVSRCDWDGTSWAVTLRNGEVVPIRQIVSVGRTAPDGRVVAAWRVKEHGHDGEGRQSQAEGEEGN